MGWFDDLKDSLQRNVWDRVDVPEYVNHLKDEVQEEVQEVEDELQKNVWDKTIDVPELLDDSVKIGQEAVEEAVQEAKVLGEKAKKEVEEGIQKAIDYGQEKEKEAEEFLEEKVWTPAKEWWNDEEKEEEGIPMAGIVAGGVAVLLTASYLLQGK